MKGRALSQAGQHDPPRLLRAQDPVPPRRIQEQVGQVRNLPSLLSNSLGFHIDCLATSITSHPNRSIKAYRPAAEQGPSKRQGDCRPCRAVPVQLPFLSSKARQAGLENVGTSTTARIQAHREWRLKCLQKLRSTSWIKAARRWDTRRCKSKVRVSTCPHANKA